MLDHRISKTLLKNKRDFLLELGCGDGYALDDIAQLYNEAVGTDISTTRFNARQTQPVNWQLILADLNTFFPFRSGSANAILANQVIEHIADPRHFAAEIFRVLKDGGVAVITTPNIRYIKHLFRLIVFGRGPKTANDDTRDGAFDDGHLHYFTHEDLRDIFLNTGFRSVGGRSLINLEGKYRICRKLLDRFSYSYIVKEFLSGNAMFILEK